MKPLYSVVVGLAALWLQVTVVPHMALFGVRPGLLLITTLLFALRQVHPAVFVYAALAGVAQDAFSHGTLGVYGISFVLAAALANLTGKVLFEENPLVLGMLVAVLSVVEGVVGLTVFSLLGRDVAWIEWGFGRVLPAGAYNGVLTPPVMYLMGRLARWFKV